MSAIKPGDELEVRNCFGNWERAIAESGVESTHRDGKKIHDFPVVWVAVAGADGPMPWPVEDLRSVREVTGDD